MRRPPLLALAALLGAGCLADDGWPDPDGAPWRVALDVPAGSNLVLLNPLEPRPPAVDVASYREVARTALQDPALAWNPCPGAGDFAAVRAVAAPDAPNHAAIAILGLAGPPVLTPPPRNPVTLGAEARTRLQEIHLAAASAVRPRLGTERPTPPDAQLRSLAKVRREGNPPLLAAVGDAGCAGIVALLDASAKSVLASDRVDLPGPTCAPLAALPPTDLDGDGRLEWVARSGNGEPNTGVFRAIWRLDPDVPALERVWRASLACDALPR